MANTKISALTETTVIADDDEFPLVDTSETETRRTTGATIGKYIKSEMLSAGFVMGFAAETPPTGWLECDGSAINRTTYADLFAAIGTIHGVGDGSTTFNIPNYQGQFLRGWDNAAGVDLGAATRTDAGDGVTTGDSVGTKQASQNKQHSHTAPRGTTVGAGAYATGAVVFAAHSITTGNSGGTDGNESRPTNVAVMYCIRY